MEKLMMLYAFVQGIVLRAFGKKIKYGPRVRVHVLAHIKPDIGSITIGRDSIIHRGAMLMAYKGSIEIGENVSVNPYTVLYGHGGLKIGDNVRIAAHTVIIPADHIFADRDTPIYKQGEHRRGITIGDDVWIGTGARILDGVTIGKGCVIAAGAVVTKDAEPYGVYAGVPARRIKSR